LFIGCQTECSIRNDYIYEIIWERDGFHVSVDVLDVGSSLLGSSSGMEYFLGGDVKSDHLPLLPRIKGSDYRVHSKTRS
jgi:hypothetical protein